MGQRAGDGGVGEQGDAGDGWMVDATIPLSGATFEMGRTMGIPTAKPALLGWDQVDDAGGAESGAEHQLLAATVCDAADGDPPSGFV